MRTILVNPPPVEGQRFIREGRCMQSVASWAAIWPPLTLAYLAAIARSFGEAGLFDCNVEDGFGISETVQRVRAFGPDVAVVNTSFPSIESDAACATAIKKACPDTLVVGVGQFFTLVEQEAMDAFPGFDVGIMGEPEMSFRDLLQAVSNGQGSNGLPGTMWRENGEVRTGAARPFIEDLDEIPFPARDLLRNERYRLPTNGHPFTLVNISRGCPHACIFCIAPAYHGRKIRRHSIEYVLEELEGCQKGLGIYDFLFWEEVFTMEREYGLSLCMAIIRKGWRIAWATTTRTDAVDTAMLTVMKKAGCFLLGLGIESSSQTIIDNACKKESIDDMRRAVDLCKQAGIKTMGHFVFGLPGETPATAEETIKFALELDLDYMQCYAAVPYPKTELGEMAAEKGWLRAKKWSDYDFGGKSILDIGTISPEEVDHFRRKMFRRFYFRPLYLTRQLAGLLAHPRQLLQAAKFLNWM